MTSTTSPEQQVIKTPFIALLESWFKLNGWNLEDIVEIIEWKNNGEKLISTSELSHALNPNLEYEPRVKFFYAIGSLNKMCFMSDESLKEIPSEIAEKLRGVRGIITNNPWCAGSFLNCFFGLLQEPPKWVQTDLIVGKIDLSEEVKTRLVFFLRKLISSKAVSLEEAVESLSIRMSDQQRDDLVQSIVKPDYIINELDDFIVSCSYGIHSWLELKVSPWYLYEFLTRGSLRATSDDEIVAQYKSPGRRSYR